MTSLVSSHLTPKELYMYVFCFSTKTGEAVAVAVVMTNYIVMVCFAWMESLNTI